jgi:hypothetical protein
MRLLDVIKLMWRRRGIERGEFFKTKTSMSVRMRLFDLEKKGGLTSWTEGSTQALAEDGFVIEVNQVMVDGFHLFTDAMKEGRRLELEWELPAEGRAPIDKTDGGALMDKTEGGALMAKGRVLWFKMAPIGSPYLFEAGVLLTEMGHEQGALWLAFTKGLRLRIAS